VTTAGVQFCRSDIRYRNRALEGYRVIFDGTAAQPLAESKEEYLVGEEKKKIEMEEIRKQYEEFVLEESKIGKNLVCPGPANL
jgi:hypothetical protein